MTEPRTADDLWAWLAACKRCGEAHEYRPPGPCGCCPDCKCPNRATPTWASLVDGHAYETILGAFKIADLRARWDSEQAP